VMTPERKKWQRFEDLAAHIQRTLSPQARVEQNVRIQGKRSGVERQVDIAVWTTAGQFEIFIAIDCKDYNTKVDVKDVEAFIGLSFLRSDIRQRRRTSRKLLDLACTRSSTPNPRIGRHSFRCQCSLTTERSTVSVTASPSPSCAASTSATSKSARSFGKMERASVRSATWCPACGMKTEFRRSPGFTTAFAWVMRRRSSKVTAASYPLEEEPQPDDEQG
jgi:hypothetical protein